MPTRRPPAAGEMASLPIAMRMRLRADLVISMACLARGCRYQAVRRFMPASGSLGATGGAEVPGCRRVDMVIGEHATAKDLTQRALREAQRFAEKATHPYRDKPRKDGPPDSGSSDL